MAYNLNRKIKGMNEKEYYKKYYELNKDKILNRVRSHKLLSYSEKIRLIEDKYSKKDIEDKGDKL